MAHDGPALIDFQIEREHNVFPMVPVGGAIHEMIRRPEEGMEAPLSNGNHVPESEV